MSEEREIALGMVVTKWAADRIVPGIKALRDNGTQHLIPGESPRAISPVDGTVLGFVTRTKPKVKVSVEDEAALMAYVQEHHPEELQDVDFICGTDDEVIAALKQSHPKLVDQKVQISEQHLNYLLKQAAADKSFRPPGIAVESSGGTVNIYPAKDQDEAFEAVIKSGAVALDGSVRPALPGGSE